jgi:hypothetical protein
MAYAVGHISGGHFNPAVTIGLWSAGRRATSDGVLYIIAQVVGAIAAASPHRCRPGRFYVIIRFIECGGRGLTERKSFDWVWCRKSTDVCVLVAA